MEDTDKELHGASALLRTLADVIDATMEFDSRREYAAKLMNLAALMRGRADRIDALLVEHETPPADGQTEGGNRKTKAVRRRLSEPTTVREDAPRGG